MGIKERIKGFIKKHLTKDKLKEKSKKKAIVVSCNVVVRGIRCLVKCKQIIGAVKSGAKYLVGKIVRIAGGPVVSIIASAVTETVSCVYEISKAYSMWKEGRINKEEFIKLVILHISKSLGRFNGGVIGSIIGTLIGSVIGTLIFPGIGTFWGGALGGFAGGIAGNSAGRYVGGSAGEVLGDLAIAISNLVEKKALTS